MTRKTVDIEAIAQRLFGELDEALEIEAGSGVGVVNAVIAVRIDDAGIARLDHTHYMYRSYYTDYRESTREIGPDDDPLDLILVLASEGDGCDEDLGDDSVDLCDSDMQDDIRTYLKHYRDRLNPDQ